MYNRLYTISVIACVITAIPAMSSAHFSVLDPWVGRCAQGGCGSSASNRGSSTATRRDSDGWYQQQQADLARLERERQQEQREREQKSAAAYASGLNAESREQWAEAASQFILALQLTPGNVDIRTHLGRVNRALADQRADNASAVALAQMRDEIADALASAELQSMKEQLDEKMAEDELAAIARSVRALHDRDLSISHSSKDARNAPIPAAVVAIGSVSNGCGPGPTASLEPRQLDTWTFHGLTSAKVFTISFRDACDLHDAAYNGAEVYDAINRGYVDHFAWSREQADEKFLRDLKSICNRELQHEPAPLFSCNKYATSYYYGVRRGGEAAWVHRPHLIGRWIVSDPKEAAIWEFKQDGRSTTAAIRGVGKNAKYRGRFTGTVVSGFEVSTLEGVLTETSAGRTTRRRISIPVSNGLDRSSTMIRPAN
jgi:hypothetical protein